MPTTKQQRAVRCLFPSVFFFHLATFLTGWGGASCPLLEPHPKIRASSPSKVITLPGLCLLRFFFFLNTENTKNSVRQFQPKKKGSDKETLCYIYIKAVS
jgi:hypothetical protein